ncbi:MAG: response regulator, partial [Deltaproteobacteria bacterium]|nr:response regulator [Deltaproteobacteria bacterium]
MPKQSLLVADADPRSLRILDVALRKAGFQVGTASDGAEALRRIRAAPHDLVLADLALPGLDGLAFVKAVRADPALAALPVLLMGQAKDGHVKVNALEAGADDFLNKPLLIKEVTARIRMLLVQKDQQRLAQKGTPAALTGGVGDLGLVDLFQTLEAWRRSGVVFCQWDDKVAEVWVVDGQVIDAQLGPMTGEPAFYRLLNWEGGTFRVEFGPVEREARIEVGTQGLLLEAMRRVDEIGRIAEQLPLTQRLQVDFGELARRLADLPDEVNGVLRQIDGIRAISEVLERSPLDELSTLAVLQRLLNEKVLTKAEGGSKPPSKPSLASWLGPDSPASVPPPLHGGMSPDGPTAPGVPLSLLQSPESDPPVAPLAPVSQPPIPAQAQSVPDPVPTPALQTGKGKKKKGKDKDEPAQGATSAPPPAADASTASTPIVGQLPLAQGAPLSDELIRAFTPPGTPKVGKPEITPEVAAASLQVEAAFAKSDADKAMAEAERTGVQAGPIVPELMPGQTAAFKLPDAPKRAVPIVRFPPLRGVRRERLRKEADEARATLEGKLPVRLTHVVELPAWPAGQELSKRRISPAVSDAAKRFAPDVPVASLGDLSKARALYGKIPDYALPTPPPMQKLDAALSESGSSKALEIP